MMVPAKVTDEERRNRIIAAGIVFFIFPFVNIFTIANAMLLVAGRQVRPMVSRP